MKTFAVCVALVLTASVAWTDDLMDAYHAEYDKMTANIKRASITASKDCGDPPTIFCVGSMSMVGRYKQDRDALKLRVLERYEKLPEWWKD